MPPRCLLVEPPAPGKGDWAASTRRTPRVVRRGRGDLDAVAWVAASVGCVRASVSVWTISSTPLPAGSMSRGQLQEIPEHRCSASTGAEEGAAGARPGITGSRMGSSCASLTVPCASPGRRLRAASGSSRLCRGCGTPSTRGARSRRPVRTAGLPRPDGRPAIARQDSSGSSCRLGLRHSPTPDANHPGGRPQPRCTRCGTPRQTARRGRRHPSVIQAILGHSTVATQAVQDGPPRRDAGGAARLPRGQEAHLEPQ